MNHLLALDGDETALKTLAAVASPFYNVLTTTDPRRFLAWLDGYKDIAVVVVEHVLATSSGVTLLESARTMRPDARRVLMTTYHDLAGIVQGLHSGVIERMVQKPFVMSELLGAIVPEGALEQRRRTG